MSAHLALGAVAALALAAAGYRRKQGSTSALPRFDAESDYVVEGVGEKSGRFIRIPAHAAGLGGTPNNDNIDYLGFVAWMTPSDFLRLNPDRPAPPRPQSKAAWAQKGIGAPMLYVDLVDDSRQSIADLILDLEDEPGAAMRALEKVSPTLRVRSHEGRGRAMFIREHLGEALMPVAVVPKGLRARHLAAAPGLLQRAVFTDLSGARRVPMGTFQLAGEVHGSRQAGSCSVRHGKHRLWVGTQRSNLASIFEKGLIPQGGPTIHHTKTSGSVFLAGSREGAWRYADWSHAADPAIVEVDVEGLDLILDMDDVEREYKDFIRSIKEASGVSVAHDAPVPEDDVDAVLDAIAQVIDGQDYALTAEVVEDKDGARFVVHPFVAIPLDPFFMRLDQDQRIELEDQVDSVYYDHRGEPHQRIEQYQHVGPIPPGRIVCAYVRAKGQKPDIQLLNFGAVVGEDLPACRNLNEDGLPEGKPRWFKQRLVQVPAPTRPGRGSMSNPGIPKGIKAFRENAMRVAAEDTAYDPAAYRRSIQSGGSPLTGHCGAVAHAVQEQFGGDIVEGRVGKERHIWNRLPGGIEVDLTGDQYGGDGFHPVTRPLRNAPARSTVNRRFSLFLNRVRGAK